MTDWFKFEKKDIDFPFYNKTPYISKGGWIILFIALIMGFLFTIGDGVLSALISCLIIVIPVLYFLKWDYKAIFQKPTLKEVGLALALFVGYMIYSVVIGLVLEQVGISPSGGADMAVNFMIYPQLIFSMMTEEFIKFIPFIFFMRVIYKYTENRKTAIIVAMTIVMIVFGMLHADSWIMLIYAIFVQGLGSIFEFYGYIKTKNMLIPYITHLAIDAFIMSMFVFGIH